MKVIGFKNSKRENWRGCENIVSKLVLELELKTLWQKPFAVNASKCDCMWERDEKYQKNDSIYREGLVVYLCILCIAFFHAEFVIHNVASRHDYNVIYH